MASSFWRAAFRRSGHVVAYGLTVVVGYLAAGRVISHFYSRVTADVETNGNGFAIFPLIIGRGAIGIFGLVAAVFVFVAIVGVGGAVLSQAWTRLAPLILDRPTGE